MIEISPDLLPYIKSVAEPALKSLIGFTAKTIAGKAATVDWFNDFSKMHADKIRRELGMIQILKMAKSATIEDIFVEPDFFDNEYSNDLLNLESDSNETISYGYYKIFNETNVDSAHNVICNQQSNHLAILGDPGAGKSTLLKAIAISAVSENHDLDSVRVKKIPFYIELRRFEDKITSENDFLDIIFNEYAYDENQRNFIGKIIATGRAIILFDGLDEVSYACQDKAIGKIESFIRKYSKCDIILSSRIGDYKRHVIGLKTRIIAPFDSKKRDRFIKKWLNVSEKSELSNQLISSISDDLSVAEITTNPLLLSLLCILFEYDRVFPSHRSELFNRCIEVLLKEWDSTRGFVRKSKIEKLTHNRKLSMLCEIALFFMTKNQRYFKRLAVINLIKLVSEKYEIDYSEEKILDELISHNGIIVHLGRDIYGFSHFTFQEFLSARHLVRLNSPEKIIDLYIDNPARINVLMLAAPQYEDIKIIFDEVKISDKLSLPDKIHIICELLNNKEIAVLRESRDEISEFVVTGIENLLTKSKLTRKMMKFGDKEYMHHLKTQYKFLGTFEFSESEKYPSLLRYPSSLFLAIRSFSRLKNNRKWLDLPKILSVSSKENKKLFSIIVNSDSNTTVRSGELSAISFFSRI